MRWRAWCAAACAGGGRIRTGSTVVLVTGVGVAHQPPEANTGSAKNLYVREDRLRGTLPGEMEGNGTRNEITGIVERSLMQSGAVYGNVVGAVARLPAGCGRVGESSTPGRMGTGSAGWPPHIAEAGERARTLFRSALAAPDGGGSKVTSREGRRVRRRGGRNGPRAGRRFRAPTWPRPSTG